MAEIGDLVPIDDNNVARWPEGMPPSDVNNAGRADEGIMSRWHRDTNGSLVSTGTSTAYQLTTNQNLTAYYDGLEITYQAHVACGNSPTLQLGTLGAANIVTGDDIEITDGDIPAGSKVNVIYNGSKFVLMNVPNAGNLGLLNTDNVWTGNNTFRLDVAIDRTDTNVAGLDQKTQKNTAGAITALRGFGLDSGSNETNYAEVGVEISDPTNGSEDGRITFTTTTGGVAAKAFNIEKGMFSEGVTGGDQGAGTYNGTGTFRNGIEYSRGWTRYTRAATTSGTSASVSGIDNTAQELIIDLDLVTLSGNSIDFQIRVGTGSTPLATGYSSQASVSSGSGTNSANSANEVLIRRLAIGTVSDGYNVVVRGTLIEPATNKWNFEIMGGRDTLNGTTYGHSTISLGAGNPLEIVELSPATGTFTGGEFGVQSR